MQLLLLDGTLAPDTRDVAVAGGRVVAHSRRDPFKQTDNEDTVAVLPIGNDSALFIVADGAGGLPAGKRASLTAVKSLVESVETAMEEPTLLRTAILNGIEAANEAVIKLGNGSATTLTVISVEGRQVRSYQIGDSEAKVVGQRGLLKMQTTAHSPTGFAVEAGFLDERAALMHRDRHLVSNFIGDSDMGIDVGAALELADRDTVMLASDGLMDNLHTDEIVEQIRKGPLEQAMQCVVEMAAERMRHEGNGEPSKPDDLSVLLFRKPGK